MSLLSICLCFEPETTGKLLSCYFQQHLKLTASARAVNWCLVPSGTDGSFSSCATTAPWSLPTSNPGLVLSVEIYHPAVMSTRDHFSWRKVANNFLPRIEGVWRALTTILHSLWAHSGVSKYFFLLLGVSTKKFHKLDTLAVDAASFYRQQPMESIHSSSCQGQKVMRSRHGQHALYWSGLLIIVIQCSDFHMIPASSADKIESPL